MNLRPPKNSTSLALYLLLNAGMKGYTSYDAVVSDRFFKFSTRISDLVRKHNLKVHKKLEPGNNRFGHPYLSTRYTLYLSDIFENIVLYNEINKEIKEKVVTE